LVGRLRHEPVTHEAAEFEVLAHLEPLRFGLFLLLLGLVFFLLGFLLPFFLVFLVLLGYQFLTDHLPDVFEVRLGLGRRGRRTALHRLLLGCCRSGIILPRSGRGGRLGRALASDRRVAPAEEGRGQQRRTAPAPPEAGRYAHETDPFAEGLGSGQAAEALL